MLVAFCRFCSNTADVGFGIVSGNVLPTFLRIHFNTVAVCLHLQIQYQYQYPPNVVQLWTFRAGFRDVTFVFACSLLSILLYTPGQGLHVFKLLCQWLTEIKHFTFGQRSWWGACLTLIRSYSVIFLNITIVYSVTCIWVKWRLYHASPVMLTVVREDETWLLLFVLQLGAWHTQPRLRRDGQSLQLCSCVRSHCGPSAHSPHHFPLGKRSRLTMLVLPRYDNTFLYPFLVANRVLFYFYFVLTLKCSPNPVATGTALRVYIWVHVPLEYSTELFSSYM